MWIKLPSECPDCGAPQEELEWHRRKGWLNCTECEWTGFDTDFAVEEPGRSQDSVVQWLRITPVVIRYAVAELKDRFFSVRRDRS